MANLDTRAKRESALNYMLPGWRLLPDPDGSDADTSAQRGMLLGWYAGILPPSPITTMIVNTIGKWSPIVSIIARWTPTISGRGKWTPTVSTTGRH